jgi:hypothetical protein
MENIDKSIIGKIMIRNGNEHQEPAVVYVNHYHNLYEYFVTKHLNTGTISFTYHTDLVDFDIKVFERMKIVWKINNAKTQKDRWKKELKEFNEQNQK